jgi:hypothetical protein
MACTRSHQRHETRHKVIQTLRQERGTRPPQRPISHYPIRRRRARLACQSKDRKADLPTQC